MANVNEKNIEQILRASFFPGLKISAYIPLGDNLMKRTLLRDALSRTAKNILQRDLLPFEVKHLLQDLYELDLSVKKNGTLALFRSQNDLFKVYLDEVVQPKIVVSESFHVKSLIWSFRKKPVSRVLFIHGPYLSLHQITLEESVLLGKAYLSEKDQTQAGIQKVTHQMASLVRKESNHLSKYLDKPSESFMSRQVDHLWHIIRLDSTGRQTFQDVLRGLRNDMILKHQARKKSFIRDVSAQDSSIKEKRPDLIAKKLINGELKGLCVSHEDLLWGELDRNSGNIRYFPHQRSAKDDDVLDDILEIANEKCIPFEIVSKDELPQGVTTIAC